MARISEIEIRDVRCFDGPQAARLGRITLLVGENGTGKSTFMGCYRTLAKLANLHDLDEVNHFDGKPFCMGPFVSVVRQKKYDLSIGAKFEDHCHDDISIAFRADSADATRPVDYRLKITYPGLEGESGALELIRPDDPGIFLRIRESGFEFDFLPGEISYHSICTWLSRYIRIGYFPFGADPDVFKRQAAGGDRYERRASFSIFAQWLRKSAKIFPSPSTFVTAAPDPTPPQRLRTYKLIPEHLNPDDTELFDFLGEMGRTLRLWKGIRIQPEPNSSGFEILVETPNGTQNLVDLGYGVHSLLPVLSAFNRHPENTVFLLQQPEVHVHPRAQAALAQWMAESTRRFIIETHSDHFMDRFRICVMKGILKPEDLSIVYFEPTKGGTESRMHSISVDAQGNLSGAPRGFRSFFLEEADRLLGFK